VIAAHRERHQTTFFLAFYNQGFDCLPGADAKQCADLVDSRCPWCGDFSESLGGAGGCTECGDRFRLFNVGGVVTAVGEGDGILAGLGQHMEFVGKTPANAAGIRQHRAKIQTQAGEDVAVGAVHQVVGGLQALLAGVKGIGILHDKFPRSHDAKAGANLVAKLGLDLVKIGGQLLVAADLAAD